MEAEFVFQADLTNELGELRVASPSIAYTGAALWLAFGEQDHVRAFEGRSIEGRWQHEKPSDPRYDVSVVRQDKRGVRSVTLRGVHARFPHVQLLPGEEILIVGARCRFTDERSLEEDNAYVFGWDGTEHRHFMLGDGIEDIQVSRAGHVWVSYFDEGVYGGLKWGGSGDSDPPASAGLLSTDRMGTILWRYHAPDGWGHIDSCYALNVGDDETWAYYYSDFPLIRIRPGGEISVWRTGVAGARAIAVDNGRRVLFFEGYWRRRSEGVLCDLGDGDDLRSRREVTLLEPGGGPLERPDAIVGRGPILHAFDGPRWYRIDLRDLPA